ncbi:nitrate reductase subunit alpha [bacterium]|nr:MAG: nitrate reductase subunit alpha [bacterium]
MSWIKDIVDPQGRRWEEFYRNRWSYDKTVRSTHGVNCTGGCSWEIFVKDGIITWELQQTDYPTLEAGLPPYEPRGCQRGISYSWYIYSPIRVKYPYVRGALLDLWEAARREHADPVGAWKSIVADPVKRERFQRARGKGGFRRVAWETALEIVAASTLATIVDHGPDRVIGFSPIPAMSMLSYAAGSRFLQLMGGVNLSFYDWYSDLPNAFPETWGEQTDVCESADWFNGKYIVAMGANLNMTRTPDVHFIAEARHAGTKFVVLSPDFSQVAKYADWWIPVHAGQDGALWMAINHVILKEFHADRLVPFFADYLKRYSDAPFLVELEAHGDGYRPGRLVRADRVARYRDVENGEWKMLVLDAATGEPRMPKGTIGYRWESKQGNWNLQMQDGLDNGEIDPLLTLLQHNDGVEQVQFSDFGGDAVLSRGVPVKHLETADGVVLCTTIYDLLMAQFGVGRGLAGAYPASYDDDAPYTPAWQERYTGIDRQTVIRLAREFAANAEHTQGRSMVIIGAGVNHWYHNNLNYRSAIVALVLCGCPGRNGGGMNHYVGQEKLAPVAPWQTIAMALDWNKPPRLQNAPSFHYVHTDQWRYEGDFTAYHPVPDGDGKSHAKGHVVDLQAKAVRLGWLPFYPQFDRSSLQVARDAAAAGAKTPAEISAWTAQQVREGKLRFAVDDPDAPACWPRVWFIWRGNALLASAKGHEYFLKHYLGTHTNAIATDAAEQSVHDVEWHEDAPKGKLDLVVDVNFRMDTSALYSDVVLPTATWYEKNDLNTTDLHSFVHPLSQAVPPCWEAKSDWEIFKALAKKISELAGPYYPEPVQDVVCVPLQHDTPDELAQPTIADWRAGECEAVPGKSMPKFAVVERDYRRLYERYISLGPVARRDGMGAHGVHYPIDDLYDEMLRTGPAVEWEGQRYPSLDDAKDAANAVLSLSPECNGEVAYRAFAEEEHRVGLPLKDLAEGSRDVRFGFKDIQRQPRRVLNSPCWSGLVTNGRAYSAYCLNVERLVPWRTLTGRQHLYLDHGWYIDFGEQLPTYKPRPDVVALREMAGTRPESNSLVVNVVTPHGKWHIHSTYYDNHRMLTLSRGIEPFWLNDRDAEKIGVVDNDWVEVYNDNGVVVTRAAVSARIPSGVALYYHAPERTISIPKSPLRGKRRAGGHNSLTRTRLNPVLMAGGYAQFTFSFNYWGPTGVNRDTWAYVRKCPELIW